MNTFFQDLEFGKQYERKLVEVLKGVDVIQKDGLFKDYDIKMTVDGKRRKYEVKSDRFAWRTGQIAIEYECSGKPSGIAATRAHYWAHFVVSPNGSDCYVIPVQVLREIIDNKEYDRTVCAGYKKLTRCYIVSLDRVKEFKKV